MSKRKRAGTDCLPISIFDVPVLKEIKLIIWILIIIAAVLLDQISKLLVVNFLDREEPFVIIKNIFQFTYVENDGAAFGSFDEKPWVFMIASTVLIVGLFIYLIKFRPESKLACVSIAMIIGGGIGNMIDRIRLGYVIDFLDFCAFGKYWVWVFNIADAFVCVGCGLMLLWCIISMIQDYKTEKAKKNASKEEADIEVEEEQN